MSDIIEFVYYKGDSPPKWRKVEVIKKNNTIIQGYDLEDGDKIKTFKRLNIVGGRFFKKRSVKS